MLVPFPAQEAWRTASRPCPATISPSSAIRIGLLKPKHQGSPASGVLRRAVARLFLCSNGLLRTCPDRNRTNLIGSALYGVAAMAGPQTPRELADRRRDHHPHHRARDGFRRE